MNKTKIDWCDATFNPISGCLHGCEYCYARNIAKRFSGYDSTGDEPNPWESTAIELPEPMTIIRKNGKQCVAPYPFGFKPTFHRYKLDEYKNKSGRNIFVCSMADMFGDFIPDEWIQEVFAACKKAPQHNYLFLTKNPKRYVELEYKGTNGLLTGDNIWYGMSITKNEDTLFCDSIGCISSGKTFFSVEPLLESINTIGFELGVRNVDWVIIGAETGRRKDKVVPERKWIEDIVNECRKYGKPVFMKESLTPIWGEDLIQEFPEGLKKKNEK